jgi:hypothetical protein
MVMLDVYGALAPPARRVSRRRRHDWVRGEVRCLMCGRLLGRLLGVARKTVDGDRSAGHPVAFLAFRPTDPTQPVVPYQSGLRFRCHHCAGAGALDAIDLFSTYDEVDAQDIEDEPRPTGRGRPRRPFIVTPNGPTGLAAALNEV